MKQCPKCRCTGRVKRLAEEDGVQKAVYVCPNPRCKNYREEFAQEELGPLAAEPGAEDG